MRFVRNHEGQAVSEYMVLLVVCVGFLMMVVSKLIVPVYKSLASTVSKKIENGIFSMDMHHYRIR
jgi:ethanolamine transporter EutH